MRNRNKKDWFKVSLNGLRHKHFMLILLIFIIVRFGMFHRNNLGTSTQSTNQAVLLINRTSKRSIEF